MADHRSTPTDRDGAPAARTDGPSLSRRALLGVVGASLAGLSGCTASGEVVMGKRDESESTYDLASGTLRVDADYGAVTVGPSDDDVVRVRVEKSGSLLSSLDAVEVTSEREGDEVVVRSRTESRGFGFWRNPPDVKIEIDLPSEVLVDSLAVTNGAVRAADVGVAADASIAAENGEAVARRLDGDISLDTQNGRSVAEEVDGFVAARSVNGKVAIRGCAGVDGAATTNGSVEADVTAIRGDTTLRTVNGAVDAALSPDLDARVVARAENGDVHVGDAFSPDDRGGNYAEGTLGEGTHELELVTTNGEIGLSRLS